MIEYMKWYQSGTQLVRCLSCGSLLSSNDTELHTRHHEQVESAKAKAWDEGSSAMRCTEPGYPAPANPYQKD